MADRHLNLFYTYNRDTELVENNLTRAFIVFLSIVSGEPRQEILSTLLGRSHQDTDNPIAVKGLDFTDTYFALQSNIDQLVPRHSARKLLLAISTEPLDTTDDNIIADTTFTDEPESGSGFRAVPDAWVYDKARAYCVLIEAKVGSYPLNIGQLQAHVSDWFGSNLSALNLRGSLCSVTWIDVLETLREVSSNLSLTPSEVTLFTHMAEFISFYGYHVFDGIDFTDLCDPPGLVVGYPLSAVGHTSIDLSLDNLSSPPTFAFLC